MKILMLNYEYPPIGGGAARAHQHLLGQYARHNDLLVDVLTASETPQFRIEKLADNICLYRIGLHKKNLHYWRKTEIIEWLFKARRVYTKLIRENRYDLVHAFFAFPSAYPCLKTVGQLPYIISLRGSDVPGFNVRLKLDYVLLAGLFRHIWKNAAAVIANSQGLADLARRFEPSLDYGIITNGVDTEYFVPPGSRDLSGRIKLLTVCRLITRKRIDLQIKTLDILLKNNIDAELNIVGDGNLEASLKSLAQTLGIANRVHFHGLIDYNKLATIYQTNHIFLMSSEHEGMSNAMLEAMACGLPIITTPCEGSTELIGENGTIILRSDAQAFSDAIAKTIENKKSYEQQVLAARKKAVTFGWANTAEAYIAIYRKMIQDTH